MYHVSTQGVDECMINVHYYYYMYYVKSDETEEQQCSKYHNYVDC